MSTAHFRAEDNTSPRQPHAAAESAEAVLEVPKQLLHRPKEGERELVRCQQF